MIQFQALRSRSVLLKLMCAVSLATSLPLVACSAPKSEGAPAAEKPVELVARGMTAPAVAVASQTEKVMASTTPTPSEAKPVALPDAASAKPERARTNALREGALSVKRFVVTRGVQAREPIATQGALLADGKPVYAFAELANVTGEPAAVRVTFERKGSGERVGNVTLEVPASTSRYRTWATTRFVRDPGEWEAVLWGAQGEELARAAFEVARE